MDNNNFLDGENNSNNSDISKTPINDLNTTEQSKIDTVPINDEDLLKVFIGKNYEKITTKPFNFAGFFFTTFYMLYRKMFLYAILLFLANVLLLNAVNNFIVMFLFSIAIGFLVNKIYLNYARNKIAKIKLQNNQKDISELIALCSRNGGTSVSNIFLGFLVQLIFSLVILIVMSVAGINGMIVDLLPDSWNKGSENTKNDTTIVENINTDGYACINSKCSVSIVESNNTVDYEFNAGDFDLFKMFNDYKDYIKINIYYTGKDDKRTIVDYKAYLKSSNEEITSIKTEDELRNKLGLYSVGAHTGLFTLVKIGDMGFGLDGEKSYAYVSYVFTDDKNNEYEMNYIISDDSKKLDLTVGNKYNVSFEVVKDTFGYNFNIKSINDDSKKDDNEPETKNDDINDSTSKSDNNENTSNNNTNNNNNNTNNNTNNNVPKNDDNKNAQKDENQTGNNTTTNNDSILVENFVIYSYGCDSSDCSVTTENSDDYEFAAGNFDTFKMFDDYKDYIKINVYYTLKDGKKTIVDYKTYLKSSNEEITNIKTEDELRNKLGLYSVGTHTGLFTLTEISSHSTFINETLYDYIDYVFADSRNTMYDMSSLKELNLTVGNKYNVTFEVVKENYGYEFYIKSIN